MEVLELQKSPLDDCTNLPLNAPLTCPSVHTLVLVGMLPMDLGMLTLLPALQHLALNFCAAAEVASLTRLSRLR